MEPGKALVARENAGLFPSAQQWQTMSQIADVLITSNLLPQHVKTTQAALAIMLKGSELGVPAMQALCSIVVVQGKPTCNAELMLALSYRDHGDEAIIITETTAERCTLSYKRRGWKERQTYSFTMDDARRAGLAETATWKKYPQAMLRARAISAVCRMAFPDSIAGMYVYEEMGLAVEVDSGEQVVVSNDSAQGLVLESRESAEVQHASTTEQQEGGEQGEAPPQPRTAAPEHQASTQGPNASDWTREEVAAQIRRLAGVNLLHLGHWQDLARTYGSAVPVKWKDMTQAYLLELYQAMQTRTLSDRIKQAGDCAQIRSCMMDAIGLRDRREISMEQYQALDEQADAHYAQVAPPADQEWPPVAQAG